MSRPIELSHCTLHLDRNEVDCQGQITRLTATESELLSYMVAHCGRTVSKEELLRNVWHYAPGVQSRAPDHTINRLRTKIESDPKSPDHLTTIYGVGYRLDLDDVEPTVAEIVPEVARMTPPGKRLHGRAAETAEVQRLLDEGARWVTVIGPGGIGKTHLVRAVVADQQAVWCDMRTAGTAVEAILVIARALGVQMSSDVQRAAHRVVQAIGAMNLELLVLDNLEQLDREAVIQVDGWLDQLPGLRVLSTSRVPLRLSREETVRLGSLEPAVASVLFHERARTVLGVDQEWDEDAVSALLHQLEGMPLAIELAAGRMGVLGPAELSDRLADDVGVLAGGRDPHHQTVLHTLERSWALLEPVEQEALVQCSVFQRPFDVAAVESVVSLSNLSTPVLSVLSQLVDSSMLRRVEGTQPRFDFFVLTRQFVEEQAQDVGAAVARHMAYFHEVARTFRAQHRTPKSAENHPEMVQMLPDLLAAAEVAKSVDSHAFNEILVSLEPIIGRELAVDQAGPMADAAVQLSQGMDAVEDRCQALAVRGRIRFLKGAWDASLSDMHSAIELALGEGLFAMGARFELQLGSQLIPRGQVKEAQAVIESAMRHAKQGHARWITGRASHHLARCMLRTHDQDKARVLLQEALVHQRAVGDRLGAARTTAYLGRIEAENGRLAQAELQFRDALKCFDGRPIPGNLSWVMAMRTEVYCRWGRLKMAERCAEDALTLTGARGTPGEVAVADFNMGMLLLEIGDVDRSEEYINRARVRVEALGMRPFQVEVMLGQGMVSFDRGDLMMAGAMWEQVLEGFRALGNTNRIATTVGMQALIALSRCDYEAALALQGPAREETLEPRTRFLFEVSLAVLHIARGEDGPAREVLADALQLAASHQIDVEAIRALGLRLDEWLQSGRTTQAKDAVVEQMALCGQAAGPDLCPAVDCSSALRWLIRIIDQHVTGAGTS